MSGEFWINFFRTEPFIPHGHCYLWQTNLVWLHILSDSLIALAYYSIPISIFYFVRKRQDLPFNWIFLLFAGFIIACGTTHIMEVWTLWHPIYWVSGTLKAMTAIISVFTAIELFPLIPQALALPSPAQLEQANLQLQAQIGEKLKAEAQLRIYQNQLEKLVAERTNELTQANDQLQQEISERKRTEIALRQSEKQFRQLATQAEEANRIKDQFLAVLSHELRSPLNPILGWSNILLTRRLTPEKTTEALTIIERNAKLQAQLIEDLLDVSRILQGKLNLNTNQVDLESIIYHALETIRLAVEAKSIDLFFTVENCQFRVFPQQLEDNEEAYFPLLSSLPHPKLEIKGDAARLQQVIWNLLSNAVKFTPPGGRVEIKLEKVNQYACIKVIDTGKGISPEFLPHVFEYFRQADSATTRKFGGLGLGLAIVKQLVELHGGIVGVESPGEEQGTTFAVQFPLLEVTRKKTRQDSQIPVDLNFRNLQGINILVVDDDNDSRHFLAFVLVEEGANVIQAKSALEALEILVNFVPDILISDIGMPEMDGYTLISQVRHFVNGAMPKAIALTAYAGEYDQRKALEAGFAMHISKPAEPHELIIAIQQVLASKGN
ncbi:ATP-binding protein [Calothrix sp. UHCC 0171]|uniref:hybrid sensor histidine kinase/response regulator n=1 Tax=Calothrix sp. UHCC 0171 TaxID=3110245 RepID=UPI002B1FA189|nr:ATP-binding protein [Calothrix sp. UHCC 0171]MEA5571767.1 ATP-binding protein [Calothrix sp. UHCC 0171]